MPEWLVPLSSPTPTMANIGLLELPRNCCVYSVFTFSSTTDTPLLFLWLKTRKCDVNNVAKIDLWLNNYTRDFWTVNFMTQGVFSAYVRFYIYLYQKPAGSCAENVLLSHSWNLQREQTRNTLWIDMVMMRLAIARTHGKSQLILWWHKPLGGKKQNKKMPTMHASLIENVFLKLQKEVLLKRR